MADIEKLKKMVMKLPVADLQTILDYAGRRKVGKKRDLQARIIGLLHQPLAGRIKKKIKEVHESLQWRDSRANDSEEEDNEDPSHDNRSSRSKNSLAPFIGHQQGSWDDSLNIYSAYNMLMDHQQKTRMPRNSVYPYPGCMLEKQSLTNAGNALPNVQLKKLPFYEPIAVLLQPTSLLPRNNRRVNEAAFQFYLTPQQADDVISSFTIEPEIGKASYVIQVQMRFCRLETYEQHDDCFPPAVSVRVNGKVCSLPPVIPTSMVGVEPKRPPRPLDLTPYIQVSSGVANRIDITWNPVFGHVHLITVSLVRKLTSEQLLDKLRTKGFCEAEHTRGLIKAKMSGDSGAEIAATSLRVSLACPLGKTRMTLPCRSSGCSHLQCFDARVFLTMNELRPTWLCPVCGQACPYDSLTLDGYFHELLSSNTLGKGVTEIQVNEEGVWSPYIKEEPKNVDCAPAQSQEFLLEEIAFDDIEVISMKPVSKRSKKDKQKEVLVDLTNSDSESESRSSSDDETSRNSDDEPHELSSDLVVTSVKSMPGTSSFQSGSGGAARKWDSAQPEKSDSSVILIDLT